MLRGQLYLAEVRLIVLRLLGLIRRFADLRSTVPLISFLDIIYLISLEQFLRRLSPLHEPFLPLLDNLVDFRLITHFLAQNPYHVFVMFYY